MLVNPPRTNLCLRVCIAILIAAISLSAYSRQSVVFESTVINSSYTAIVKAFLEKPEGNGPFPAVVLMHGCAGLTGASRRGMDEHTEYLVSRGFATLVIDSFSTRGKADGYVCLRQGELASARYYRHFDAYHALVFLQSQSFVDVDNIFLMEQSNGGSVALEAALGPFQGQFPTEPRFQGIVAFYPWCGVLPTWPHKIVSPLLVLGAGKDDWVDPGYCVSARDQVSGADYEVLIYSDAHHGFDLLIPEQEYAGHLIGGNPGAASDSREKMANWFLKHRQ